MVDFSLWIKRVIVSEVPEEFRGSFRLVKDMPVLVDKRAESCNVSLNGSPYIALKASGEDFEDALGDLFTRMDVYFDSSPYNKEIRKYVCRIKG